MDILKAGCVQMCSGPDIGENLSKAETLIRQAVSRGATFVVTPENTCHIRAPMTAKLESAPEQENHPGIQFFAELAAELDIWLLIGSMSVKLSPEKLLNRSFLFSNTGKLVATYDKLHMFDADPRPGETYRESGVFQPGQQAVLADIEAAKLGLTICYDVRFPNLYRDLAKAGAEIIAVPAAFAVTTGQAHWDILLRARAIETGSFIVAPGQTGEHQNGRATWGHSMIISPWGQVLGEMGEEEGVIVADLKLSDVERARKALPNLQHIRDYEISYVI